MDTEKMREEFEAAYLKDVCERTSSATDDGWLERGSDGEYRSYRANGAWWAWQASRESLVIELPESYMDGICESMEADDVRKAIEAAGLKVKS